MYYTSSILMAVPWLMILFLIMGGYYGCYIYKYKEAQLGAKAGWLMIAVFALFALVGLIFSSNIVLMMSPEQWPALFSADKHGMFFYWQDPQQLPRYLPFLLASVAVTGLAMGCFGLYWNSREHAYGQWLIKTGAGIFSAVSLLQVLIGGWFLMSVPRAHMMNFMGGNPYGTAVFAAAMVMVLLALLSAVLAWKDGKPLAFKISLVSSGLLLVLMSLMRHLLREYYVSGVLHPEALPVKTQWDLLTVFVLSAVGLIVYLIWLGKVAWQGLLSDTSAASN
ncbi:MAG: hypothetical protein R2857_15090 [Vampirovibrionales bacterium]